MHRPGAPVPPRSPPRGLGPTRRTTARLPASAGTGVGPPRPADDSCSGRSPRSRSCSWPWGSTSATTTRRRTRAWHRRPPPTSPRVTTATSDAEPVAFAGAGDHDPQGDLRERSDDVGSAIDGDRDTFWPTETYTSADFGGLGKEGVGIWVELEEPTELDRVELELGSDGGAVELWASADGPHRRRTRTLRTGARGSVAATSPVTVCSSPPSAGGRCAPSCCGSPSCLARAAASGRRSGRCVPSPVEPAPVGTGAHRRTGRTRSRRATERT
jgi:hypothetical protein